jgi:mycoredoxin
VTGDERLTVYWRPGCPFCAKLRARLKVARVPYRGVDIWQDPEAAALVREHNGGDELVPTVCLDGDRWFSNPRFGTLRAAMRG